MSALDDHAPVPHATPLAALMAARRITRGAIRDNRDIPPYANPEHRAYARGYTEGKRDVAAALDRLLDSIEHGLLP